MRVTISQDPFLAQMQAKNWREQGLWPASWIGCPGADLPPMVTAYRRRFKTNRPASVRVHVSADERYELFLDGERLGRGPERGAPHYWFFETYDLPLEAGNHTIVAKVWSLGDAGGDAQMSALPGFLLAAEGKWGALLSTGQAAWEAKKVEGIGLMGQSLHLQRGCRFSVDARRYPWEFESGAGRGWLPALTLKPARGRWTDWDFYKDHLLKPAALPPMSESKVTPGVVRHAQAFNGAVEERVNIAVSAQTNNPAEAAKWKSLLEKKTKVTIPANSARRVIVELPDYTVAYPLVVTSGGEGGLVEVMWAEALKMTPDFFNTEKGSRDDIEGKYFVGAGDHFILDGAAGRRFEPLWWMAGRYVEIYVQTGAEAVKIEEISFTERRYPLEMHSRFSSCDIRLEDIRPILLRGMQMCANETFFDCPYYEELMYAGDTRLESLVTYILGNDDRLPRKALRLYDVSRMADGMTQSRYPCKTTQVISTFALWWVGMVHDFLYWRSDLKFVRELLPGVRATMQGFQRLIGEDGLLRGAEGWNTIDWVPAWSEDAGVPPEGHSGISGLLNWQYIYGLSLYQDLETQVGDAELAAWAGRKAGEMAVRASEPFWCEERGLFADTLDHTRFSEHTQIMALLSGVLDPHKSGLIAEQLFLAADLDRTTIYFSHYYFEVCRLLGRMDAFFDRMGLWFYLKEMGFKTPVESPEPSRSDCHAWSSHPLFHYFATLLGIRPAQIGFASVVVAPQLGSLTQVSGWMPHPGGGEIGVELRLDGGRLDGMVTLPGDLTGTFLWNGKEIALNRGENPIGIG